MKKHYAFALLFVALVISFSSVVSAQTASSSIREKMRAIQGNIQTNIQTKAQNLKENRDVRNNTLGQRMGASTTAERKEIRTEARKDVFTLQINKLVKELRLSVSNLKQIRERISSRIEKMTQNNNTNVATVRTLLATADSKITLAVQAIDTLANYKPATSTPIQMLHNNTSSTEPNPNMVNLTKPRQIGDTAIKAVQEAKKALNDVVVAILQL